MEKKTLKAKKKAKDPCPACERDLFYNKRFTQRVGLIDDDDDVVGWMCPHCKTEFDFDGRPVVIYGVKTDIGEA